MTAPAFRFLSFQAMNEPFPRSGNDDKGSRARIAFAVKRIVKEFLFYWSAWGIAYGLLALSERGADEVSWTWFYAFTAGMAAVCVYADERKHKDEFFRREFSWLKLVRLRKRSDKGDER